MKILFAGGGTLGPVSPLLAVKEAWTDIDPSLQAIWVGTPNGPERAVVEAVGIPFISLPVFRFPRYPSFEWVLAPVQATRAFVGALIILVREQPDLVATAGGYTGVPLAFFAWCFRIPVWIHQQDATVLLANRLMAPFATLITVAWPDLVSKFSKQKTEWIGNPVRKEGKGSNTPISLDPTRPTVVVLGGGSGSVWLNERMEEIGSTIAVNTNVVHVTGLGKNTSALTSIPGTYQAIELIPEGLRTLLSKADVVVSRVGMATLSEIASVACAAIFIPLPDTPQEANAKHIRDTQSGIVLSQRETTSSDLLVSITSLLSDEQMRIMYAERIHQLIPTDVSERLVERLRHLQKNI